jgi:hypothetical protein
MSVEKCAFKVQSSRALKDWTIQALLCMCFTCDHTDLKFYGSTLKKMLLISVQYETRDRSVKVGKLVDPRGVHLPDFRPVRILVGSY